MNFAGCQLTPNLDLNSGFRKSIQNKDLAPIPWKPPLMGDWLDYNFPYFQLYIISKG